MHFWIRETVNSHLVKMTAIPRLKRTGKGLGMWASFYVKYMLLCLAVSIFLFMEMKPFFFPHGVESPNPDRGYKMPSAQHKPLPPYSIFSKMWLFLKAHPVLASLSH